MVFLWPLVRGKFIARSVRASIFWPHKRGGRIRRGPYIGGPLYNLATSDVTNQIEDMEF